MVRARVHVVSVCVCVGGVMYTVIWQDLRGATRTFVRIISSSSSPAKTGDTCTGRKIDQDPRAAFLISAKTYHNTRNVQQQFGYCLPVRLPRPSAEAKAENW